jgi:DNA-directed RNA polymerase subunit RPC12/RpoP
MVKHMREYNCKNCSVHITTEQTRGKPRVYCPSCALEKRKASLRALLEKKKTMVVTDANRE